MTIGYKMVGSGSDLVIVLHEWLGDSRNWEPVIPYLPVERHRYAFADLRGYGFSKDVRGSYSLDEAAEDVAALAKQLGFDSFYLIAHSMSGLIAQRLAQTNREAINSILLISPVPASGFKMDDAAFERLLNVAKDDTSAREAISVRTGHRYGKAWLERKLAMARQSAGVEAMQGYARMITQSDISAAAKGISIPFSVITGRHDLPIYRQDSVAKLFGELYPNLSVIECLEAGHYAMLEAPVYTASKIEEFLQRN